MLEESILSGPYARKRVLCMAQLANNFNADMVVLIIAGEMMPTNDKNGYDSNDARGIGGASGLGYV